MGNSFYCVCDNDCIVAGSEYYKDRIYCINEMYIMDRYYEVNTMEDDLVGYVNPYELDLHFSTVMFIINDIDKEFNKIMDIWR